MDGTHFVSLLHVVDGLSFVVHEPVFPPWPSFLSISKGVPRSRSFFSEATLVSSTPGLRAPALFFIHYKPIPIWVRANVAGSSNFTSTSTSLTFHSHLSPPQSASLFSQPIASSEMPIKRERTTRSGDKDITAEMEPHPHQSRGSSVATLVDGPIVSHAQNRYE